MILRKAEVSSGAPIASLTSAATLAEGPKLEKPVWKQWRRLLLLVLFTMQLPWRRLDVDMGSAMIRSGTADTETETLDERQWEDLRSPEYKGALQEHFETRRNERYSHLSEHRLMKLRTLVKDHSEVFVIEGVVPTTVSGYEFDIELEPGAKPVRQQLPKLAPQSVAKERYHVLKEEQLGHLRVPGDEAKSDWATRTHVVSKKGDPNGRWICDFRPLNRVSVKRCTAIGDVFSKIRPLASKRWKSGLDAQSGFNPLKATERASRLLQIITTFGVRQWTVLPFGATNGPSCFQVFMLTLYGGSKHGPDMLGESVSDLDAIKEVWIDGVQLGSGTLDDKIAREKDDLDSNDGSDGFDQHFEALGRVLKRASLAKLRFKLDKRFFAQCSWETFGTIAGNGAVKADPKKVQGIVSWPTPTRVEDVEKFLATTVFIREHLSPQYVSAVVETLARRADHLAREQTEGVRESGATHEAPPRMTGKWRAERSLGPLSGRKHVNKLSTRSRGWSRIRWTCRCQTSRAPKEEITSFPYGQTRVRTGLEEDSSRDAPRAPPRHCLTTPRSVYRLGPVRPRSLLSVSSSREHHAVIAALAWKP